MDAREHAELIVFGLSRLTYKDPKKERLRHFILSTTNPEQQVLETFYDYQWPDHSVENREHVAGRRRYGHPWNWYISRLGCEGMYKEYYMRQLGEACAYGKRLAAVVAHDQRMGWL